MIKKSSLQIQYETSIKNINKNSWNQLLGMQNAFDWDGLHFLESAFSNNDNPEINNWDFHYFIIKDKNNNPIVATFFTHGLWKDDMLASESISLQLEETRKHDPLYLTSKVLSMGCLFTEGNHCYINKSHPMADEAIVLLLEQAELVYQKLNADMLILRDFEEDVQLNTILHNRGFLKINMPDSCVVEELPWNNVDGFVNSLSKRSKRHFLEEVLPFEKSFDIVIKNQLTPNEMEHCYSLYKNVKNRNQAINSFTYPKKIFIEMSNHPNWEFMLLYLKNNIEEQTTNQAVGVMFCYKNMEHTYVPSLIGMDYVYAQKFQIYRQLLYQTIKRTKELNFKKIDFGFSATFEKKKLGAVLIPKVAYVQAKDNFSMELMGTLQNEEKK